MMEIEHWRCIVVVAFSYYTKQHEHWCATYALLLRRRHHRHLLSASASRCTTRMRSARDNTHTKIAAAAGAGAGGGALNKQKRKRRSKYFKRECGTWPMATGCVARARSQTYHHCTSQAGNVRTTTVYAETSVVAVNAVRQSCHRRSI